MAKATKVQSDDECDKNNGENKCDSDDDNEPTKGELFDMLEYVKTHFDIKRRKCKDLKKELKALKQAFDELNASHESPKEDHEKLGKAHKKLKKAHSSLLNMQNEKEKAIVTCDIGLTCDIIDESFYKPNPSCSTSTSTSSSSDSFTCDASLMVENETLKKEVNELTYALGNVYGGEAHLLKCLGGQIFSLNKEGLGYTPRKIRWPLLLTRLVFEGQ
jgi:hypothetical protein